MAQIGEQITSGFARTWRLDVDHFDHPRIDCADVHRAAGFQRHAVTLITQGFQQCMGGRLGKWLTAGHSDVLDGKVLHAIEDRRECDHVAAGEGISRIAVGATQWAASRAHEYRRPTAGYGLALNGQEDLGYAQNSGQARWRCVRSPPRTAHSSACLRGSRCGSAAGARRLDAPPQIPESGS